MPRKPTGKHRLMDDDISDSEDSAASDLEEQQRAYQDSLDADEQAEFALNANPYGNRKNAKRRKVDMFSGLEEQESQYESRGLSTKTPKFVSASSKTDAEPEPVDNLSSAFNGRIQEPVNEEIPIAESSGSEETDSDMDQDDDGLDPPVSNETPQPEEEGIDFTSNTSGLGSNNAGLGSAPSFSRGGIGSSRGGIGARPSTSSTPSTSTSAFPPLPTAFGSIQRQPRSFLSQPTNSAPSTPKPQLTSEEAKHFSKLEAQGGVGYKLLAKMGWASGTGLGNQQQGRVTPVDSQLRPRQAGLGAGGFSERTKQAKVEAKRRGEVLSDEEENEGRKGKGKGKKGGRIGFGQDSRDGTPQPQRDPAWKRQANNKPRKSKVEHKTYEEVLLEAGDQQGVDSGVGQLIDISGAALPSLASSLSLNVPVPSSDTTRLPEIRHNLKLIIDTAQGELASLAKEGKAVQEKRRWIDAQALKATAKVTEDSERIIRLDQVSQITTELDSISKSSSFTSLPLSSAFNKLENPISRLIDDYAEEFAIYNVDEAVVASITPLLRAHWIDWDPLEEPDLAVPELKKWKRALPMNRSKAETGSMTPYEALLWTHWLPRIRSAINNSWSPANPSPAATFFSAWAPILPRFLHDNVLDQLILPKISKAVADWTPKSSVALHTLVLPWVELAGPRIEEMLDEAKRKVKGWLKTWRPRDGVPAGFEIWRDVYSATEWDDLMLRYIVPQLGTTLRDKFQINPRSQNLEPLERVLAWSSLLRISILDQLLETEFFAKWLEALFVWLTNEPNYQQVTEWYLWWKSYFDDSIASQPGVSKGFMKGLDLMNSAMALGDDAKYRLRRPDAVSATPAPTKASKKIPTPAQTPVAEVSFRSLVEEYAAQNNLVFLPTGKSHQSSGQVLFRVSVNVDGKSGITVYLKDDIVWVQEGSSYAPIGLQEMVERIQKQN